MQMLRQKPQWGTFLPALAAGLAAAMLAFLLVRSRTPAEAATPTILVVVAARDLPARTRLTPALLALRLMPPNDIPEGAAKTPAVFVGKITTGPIGAGTAVTDGAVVAPSAALGVAFSLPPTLRAVTVATDPADGGADLFVRPEDHVDILATDEPGSGPAEARTVLQNVRLLAVGGSTSPDPPPASASSSASGGAAHVTVAVTPAQAQMLVLAAARGHLHLSLRAIGDGSQTPIPALPAPVPARSLLREPPRPHAIRVPPSAPKIMPLPPLPVVALRRPPAGPPTPVSVVVIKGTVSQTVTVAP
jgi:pilus assembly protein CpaB